jgi:8-oxo-dGTP pyrophosphatase MutT (NUDIX family)
VELKDEPERWPVRATEDIWRGAAPFAVRRDVVSRPGHDETFGRVVVEHPGAVVVLAVDDDERALVLRQYRHPSGMRFVELPAGLLDVPGEDPLLAARRELLEEGAVEAADWQHLNTIHNSPGISDERIEIYLARGLSGVPDRGGFQLEHEEADMTLHWVPVADLLDGVLRRTLTDGPLVTAVLTYAHLHPSRSEGPAGRV